MRSSACDCEPRRKIVLGQVFNFPISLIDIDEPRRKVILRQELDLTCPIFRGHRVDWYLPDTTWSLCETGFVNPIIDNCVRSGSGEGP